MTQSELHCRAECCPRLAGRSGAGFEQDPWPPRCRRVSGGLALLATLIVLLSSLGCSGSAGPTRFVAAAKPNGANIAQVLQSFDGLAWSVPHNIVDAAGMAVPASTSIGIAYDGRLYHAAWFDGSQRLRYATSGNGDNWLASSSPLGVFPVGSQARPAVAIGAGKILVAFLQSGRITVVDIAAPANPVVVPGSASAGPGLAFGNGRFVLAFPSRSPNSLQVRTSTDGASWQTGGNILAAAQPPGAAALAFDGGVFQLVQRVSVSTGVLSRIDLETFTSPDGATWTAGDVPQGFPFGTGTAVSRTGSSRIILDAVSRVHSFVGGNSPQRVNWTALNGLGISRGSGRPIVSFTLDSVTVRTAQENSGDEPYFLMYSFHSRVARPGSTRVHWSGALEKVGDDMASGTTRPIPPDMGATAWTIEQARNLQNSTNGRVDIMGAVIIALAEDNCPDSGVAAKARQAQGVILTALESLIASGNLATLLDKTARDAAVAAAVTGVRNSLGGGSGFVSFFGCVTDRDDQIQDRIVLFVGTEFFTDDPAARTFAVDPARSVLPVSLTFANSDANWRVAARLRYH